MNRKGFTLIELVLVIAILGILAVAALPRFIDITDNAQAAARDGVVGAVRSGIALQRASGLVALGTDTIPPSLESGACCFGNVLSNPVTTGWATNGTTSYIYNPTTTSFVYNPADGSFQ